MSKLLFNMKRLVTTSLADINKWAKIERKDMKLEKKINELMNLEQIGKSRIK